MKPEYLAGIAALITAIVTALAFFFNIIDFPPDNNSGNQTSVIPFAAAACTDNSLLQPGTDERDTIYGNNGANVIDGEGKDDIIYGCGGNDVIQGGTGEDKLDGGVGIDSLEGGSGHDIMTGGAGGDSFDCGNDNEDRILDYNEGEGDTITGDCKV